MWRNRFVYFAVLLAAITFAVFYEGYISLYLLRVIISLPIISLLGSLPSILAARLSVTADTTAAHRGDEVPLKILLISKLPYFSGRCAVTLEITNRFGDDFCTERLSLPFGCRAVTVVHRVGSSACGRLVCRLKKPCTTDCLGLFSIPIRFEKSHCEISFYPVVCGAQLGLRQNIVADETGERYSLTHPGDDPTEIFGFREYREGDRISRINYKLSEKLGKTIVKEYSQPATGRRAVLLSLGGERAEIEAQLDALATLADFLIENGGFTLALCGDCNCVFSGEITATAELLTVLDIIFDCGKNLPKTGGVLNLTGVSHTVYICDRPSAVVIGALPQGEVTVLHTKPMPQGADLPNGARVVQLACGDIKPSLNQLEI